MRSFLFALCIALAAPSLALAQSDPTGRWKTIDDETGQARSVVDIRRLDDGSLSGTVAEILQSDRGPNPTCDRCSGANRDKPIRGMTILWGLRPDGENSWAGGTILDPAKGKTYRSKAQLIDDNRLGVSGCVAFICREQVWQRE